MRDWVKKSYDFLMWLCQQLILFFRNSLKKPLSIVGETLGKCYFYKLHITHPKDVRYYSLSTENSLKIIRWWII